MAALEEEMLDQVALGQVEIDEMAFVMLKRDKLAMRAKRMEAAHDDVDTEVLGQVWGLLAQVDQLLSQEQARLGKARVG
jgi:hypothetical protein